MHSLLHCDARKKDKTEANPMKLLRRCTEDSSEAQGYRSQVSDQQHGNEPAGKGKPLSGPESRLGNGLQGLIPTGQL